MMNGPTASKRTRVIWSPEERADWVQMFEQSGKSVAEFCRDNDLAEATLSLWRSKAREPVKSAEGSPLVEVSLPPPASPVSKPMRSAMLKARLPSGIELEVACGTDVQWLSAVLRALTVA